MTVRTISVVGLAFFLLCSTGCDRVTPQSAKNLNSENQESVDQTGTDEEHPLNKFEERNDDPIAAAADRYQRRLSADGTVPDRALLNAKAQRDRMLAQVNRPFRSSKKGGARNLNNGGAPWPVDWDWKGPGNIGGRLRPIVIHPTSTNVMYVGSASGGIWKTINSGGNWFPLDDFLPSLSVSDMVMHPDDSDVLYAATGEGFFEAPEGSSNTAAVRGAGIFKSVDAGTTWAQISSTDNPNFYFVNRLAFDPSDSDVMLAATGTGVWRSVDEGLTWTLTLAIDALDVKFNPNDPMKVVAGGHHELDGPSYSSDGGMTWQTANGAGAHRQEMAWSPSVPGKVYAAVSDDNGRIKVWESTDNGANYTLVTTGNGIQTWASYNNTIWVDPTNDDFMILGGVWLYNSVNGGESFTRRFNAVHADMHRIVPHPVFDGVVNKTVYFATDGGIWQTTDVYGNSASDLNNNLGVTQFYGGGISPATGNIVGGTQDNGTLFYSGDPQNWDHIFGGDGGYGAADPTDSNYFYGEVQRAYLHRSSNGGGSSSYIWNGPNPIGDAGSSDTNFIPFFMLDPNDPNRMLVACERMWRSNNVKAGQPDWFSMKDSIATPGPGAPSPGKGAPNSHFNPNAPENISTIDVAIGNSDIIWAAHNNGNLYYTTNGTAASPTWIRVDENGVGLPDRWISTIRINPNDHNHVYVAFMGWESDNLWETTDGGTTWTDVSGNGTHAIPSAPISALAIHPNLSGWLFVGTDIGIFSTHDNGLTWSTTPEGPAATPVEQLLWKNHHELLAVTHGRGMFLATEKSVLPEADKLLDGVITSGSLADVFSSNDVYMELDPSPTGNPIKQIVELIVQSTSTSAAPGTFHFRVQASMAGGPTGDVLQEIKLFNYNTNAFETLDTRPAENSDQTVLVIPGGDLSRFVQSGTGEITAVVKWTSPSFAGATFNWSVDLDEAVWVIDN